MILETVRDFGLVAVAQRFDATALTGLLCGSDVRIGLDAFAR